MRTNWFFRRNRCCNCCRCCNRHTDSSSEVFTVFTARHFADVPMRVFFGPGFTERDVLESIDDSLQTIADASTVRQSSNRRRSNCCSC